MQKYVNNSEKAKQIRLKFAEGQGCHSSRGDGECYWEFCPQNNICYLSFCPLVIDYEEDEEY